MVQIRLNLLLCIVLTGSMLEAAAQDNLSIRKIRFTGNDSIRKESLLKQMNTKPPALTKKLTVWERKTGFNNFTFEEDISRLTKYYQRNGFLEPVINYKLLTSKNLRKLDIFIQISHGNAVTIDQVNLSVKGNSTFNQLIDSLGRVIPLKPSSRFRDEGIIAAEKIIHAGFATHGYPFIKITRDITLKPLTNTADIIFTIDPGNKSFFGQIQITGDSLISRSLISKHIGIKNGDVFSQSKLEETQEELFDLALFRYVIIRALMDSIHNDSVPVAIQLKELPRWSLKTGVGYGTEDRIRVSVLLTRLNFLGGGRTFIIKGQHSYFIPLNIETKFIQPDIWGKDLDFILNPFFTREREDSYVVDRLGTSGTFQKRFTKKTAAFVSYTYGKDKVDLTYTDLALPDEDQENLNNTKSGMTLGFNRSTADNLFAPTQGWKTEGRATYMGIGFNSQYHYFKIMAEVDFFHSLWENVILAIKLKSGTIKPVQGDLLTPIEDRFLMGGAQSLRGWGRNQISPVNIAGDKLGGSSMLESTAELRFPVYGIFSAAIFMDAGNVWLESWGFNLHDMHYDLGFGLRIKTPVGPIRLDVATPIFSKKFNAQFFITIGHAF